MKSDEKRQRTTKNDEKCQETTRNDEKRRKKLPKHGSHLLKAVALDLVSRLRIA